MKMSDEMNSLDDEVGVAEAPPTRRHVSRVPSAGPSSLRRNSGAGFMERRQSVTFRDSDDTSDSADDTSSMRNHVIDVPSGSRLRRRTVSGPDKSGASGLDRGPSVVCSSSNLRRRRTADDAVGTKRASAAALEHRNDKNDSDASLSFKEFRRSLSILKRSLNQGHVVHNGVHSFFGIDSDDETDEDEQDYQGGLQSVLQQLDESDHRLSPYALGTSSRSVRSLTRKSKLPVNCNKRMKWLKSFYRLDPRWQICQFFDDLAHEGVEGIDETGRIQVSSMPFIMRAFSRVGVFSVWRPTSNEAIRHMITGDGTGKGMDIKGKSAIRGKWSGFVPFLQIHRNVDKFQIGSLRADARVRVFYPNKLARDRAFMSIAMMRGKMVETNMQSMRFIMEVEKKEASVLVDEVRKSFRNLSHASMLSALGTTRKRLSSGPDSVDYAKFEAALEAAHHNCMLDDAAVYKIDDYASTQGCYGLDVPEKLFWETYVSKTDISREDGSEYDTGRASMPEFQVMNLESLRKIQETGPRPVLWHAGCGKVGEEPLQIFNPLSPFDLLMAYEEAGLDDGKVTPVVSDFDCFLVGTRRVEYRNPLGEQERSMLNWCVDEIEGVLDNPTRGKCWTRHWLDVKKKYAFDPRFLNPMPNMGYSDARSKALMKGAVFSLRQNGAVRHGPECFNYSFPQPLDDQYLVISDTLPGLVPWKYVDAEELMEILAKKIDDGFAFPLNPKWILCDEGWKDLYDKLLASEAPNVQQAMNVWYPAEIRERIAAISSKHPRGFCPREESIAGPAKCRAPNRRLSNATDLEQYELGVFKSQKEFEEFTAETAELQVERYKHARSGVAKLRRALLGKIKKRKKSEDTFFSAVLLMLQLGKEADAQIQCTEDTDKKKTGSKMILDRLRNSFSGSDHDVQRRSSLTLETTSSISSDRSASNQQDRINKLNYNHHPSRRKNFTRYLRKKLTSKKKVQRQNTV